MCSVVYAPIAGRLDIPNVLEQKPGLPTGSPRRPISLSALDLLAASSFAISESVARKEGGCTAGTRSPLG